MKHLTCGAICVSKGRERGRKGTLRFSVLWVVLLHPYPSCPHSLFAKAQGVVWGDTLRRTSCCMEWWRTLCTLAKLGFQVFILLADVCLLPLIPAYSSFFCLSTLFAVLWFCPLCSKGYCIRCKNQVLFLVHLQKTEWRF